MNMLWLAGVSGYSTFNFCRPRRVQTWYIQYQMSDLHLLLAKTYSSDKSIFSNRNWFTVKLFLSAAHYSKS